MRRCKAVQFWLSGLLIFSMIGCASLRKEDDPNASYGLPGDEDPDRGMFTSATDSMLRTIKSSVGLGPNEAAAREQFAAAKTLYESAGQTEGYAKKKQFEAAAAAFDKAAARWPNSSIAEDAMFFRAESLFFADRYPRAEDAFGSLVAKYTSTKHIDQVSRRRLQIAKYWLDHHKQSSELAYLPNITSRDRPTFDEFGHAIKLLESIRLDDPTGELADDATMLAAESCFRTERFYRADELLEDLRRSFPNSPHQFAAHKMGLQVKIKLYQGPNYDAGPLDDAEEIVNQMYRQFPSEAKEDAEFLSKAFKDVRMNRAIRAMKIAQYRDTRKEYGAARAQYERVAREFSDTSLAQDAETRLAQIDGRPDLPPQRLQMLAKPFERDEGRQTPLLTGRGVTRR